ncbi:MAG: cyclic nucleotide-binding domain-containing protein [Leptospirales bacterium]|nr:cyclic nucleotide-binding domain-containing protein [Leptospirales bacterium]
MARSALWESLRPRQSDAEREMLDRLGACPAFEELPDRALRVVRDLCHVRHYKQDEHVFRRGEPAVGMYIVLEGEVEIYRLEGEFRRTFGLLQPGDFFGELGLLEESPRTASARCLGYTRLLGFFRPDLLSLVTRKPRMGAALTLNIARLTARRLIHTNQELEEMQIRLRTAGLDEAEHDPYGGGLDPD